MQLMIELDEEWVQLGQVVQAVWGIGLRKRKGVWGRGSKIDLFFLTLDVLLLSRI